MYYIHRKISGTLKGDYWSRSQCTASVGSFACLRIDKVGDRYQSGTTSLVHEAAGKSSLEFVQLIQPRSYSAPAVHVGAIRGRSVAETARLCQRIGAVGVEQAEYTPASVLSRMYACRKPNVQSAGLYQISERNIPVSINLSATSKASAANIQMLG